MEQPVIQRPKPKVQDPIEQEFWDQCQDGTLYFQRCSSCSVWRFLPRYTCAKCGSFEFEWAPSTGRGSIFSWTVTHQAFHPAFAADVPYAAIVVELEESVRMASRLVNCSLDAIALDMPVEVCFERIADDFILPCFQPVGGAKQ
ncbi:MAG: OB-fold domain-containing protein [Parvibaculum sp.]